MLTENINEIISSLKNQNTVSIPTDTVYGLSCIISKKAIENIIKLKQRPLNKGFIVISADAELLLDYVDISKLTNLQIEKINQPALQPTTWIVPTKKSKQLLTGSRDTIAIRLVKTDLLKEITKILNAPIISTSANISGQDPVKTANDINNLFKNILVYNSITKSNIPSKIIDLKNNIIIR